MVSVAFCSCICWFLLFMTDFVQHPTHAPLARFRSDDVKLVSSIFTPAVHVAAFLGLTLSAFSRSNQPTNRTLQLTEARKSRLNAFHRRGFRSRLQMMSVCQHKSGNRYSLGCLSWCYAHLPHGCQVQLLGVNWLIGPSTDLYRNSSSTDKSQQRTRTHIRTTQGKHSTEAHQSQQGSF